jgi:hypothetical protein
MAAAGSSTLARVWSDLGNKCSRKLQWSEQKEGGSSKGDGVSRHGEFIVRPLMATAVAQGTIALREEGEGALK